MKVIIFSDSHDSIKNIDSAFSLIEREGIESDYLIHCGDICSLETLSHIANLWRGEIHFCFGNMDGDGFAIPQSNSIFKKVYLHGGEFGQLEIGGKKIAFQHFPEVAQNLAGSGDWDAVFYGHTHKRHSEYIGKTLLANPGTVSGIKHSASFAVYSSDDSSLDFIEI